MTNPRAGDDGSRHRMPTWVKVFVAVAVILLIAIVVMVLSDGGHGPSRHLP